MRHVKVYNVWYDYHLFPNILPRQVLLYLIYHERVHSLLLCPVWRLWVLRGARPGPRQRERKTSSWAQSPLSWAVLCTAHYTVQADTAGLGDWGVSDRELARPETRAAIWAVSRQYLLLFPRPRLLWLSLWLSVTECDSVTGVTRDSEIVRKIHLNSSNFYKNTTIIRMTKCSDKLEFKLQCLLRATDTGGGNWRCQ